MNKNGKEVRLKILQSYIDNDLLGANSNGTSQLLLFNNSKVKSLTLKLINAMCSDSIGKEYLLKDMMIIPVLTQIAKS